tara:strand:+ start:524 stop:673 length:150 start_codon:yes stop_codon:yes gene_type:complete
MYKVIVYSKDGSISKYVYFNMRQAKAKSEYLELLFKNNVAFKEEFFIQL